MPANLENSAVATGLKEVSFHSNPKERQCQRVLNLLYSCTHFISSKILLKILQSMLQQYVNRELPDVQDGFRKGRKTRDQIANICWIIEKSRKFQKKSTSASLTRWNPLTEWITTNYKILKEMGIPDHLICLLRNLYAGQEATVKTRDGTMDWFKIGKGGTSRLYIVTLPI